jgi:RES domain
VTARKAHLGGNAQIALKDYPRLMYVVAVEAKRCVDFRSGAGGAVLKEALAAALDPDDLSASQEVGVYLAGKGIDAMVFRSVVCEGSHVVVFRDALPAPTVQIDNRDEIREAIEAMAKRGVK